jgi:hypothetical protein
VIKLSVNKNAYQCGAQGESLYAVDVYEADVLSGEISPIALRNNYHL